MNRSRICLIFPPNDGCLGGIGYVNIGGKLVKTPLFPRLPNVNLVKSKSIKLKKGSAPLGILYVAAELVASGYEAAVLDLQAEKNYSEKLAVEIRRCQLIGISSIADSQRQTIELCQTIRQIKPEIPIIVGGPDATLNPEAYLSIADVVLLGEAEGLIGDLADTMIGGADLTNFPNIVYRDTRGIAFGPHKEAREDIDNFPLPARHLLEPGQHDFLGSGRCFKADSLITARGCPYGCTFCARPALLGKTFRQRSVVSVLDEMEILHDSGVRYLSLADSNFLVDPKRAMRIMEGILKRGMKLRMNASVSVHSASEELYQCLYEGGMRVLSYGFESGNDETMSLFRKRATVEDNMRAAVLSDKVGMFVKGNFILGAPNEGWEEVLKTIEFARRAPIDVAHFSTMTYFYGSPLWEEAFQAGLIRADERAVYATRDRGLGKLSQEELADAYILAMKRFYRRASLPAGFVSKLLRKGNRDLIPLAIRAATSTLSGSSLS